MAVGKNTIPQSTVDKNGRQTVVHVNPNKHQKAEPTAGSTRVSRVAAKPTSHKTPSLLPTTTEVVHLGSTVRFYTTEQKLAHFPRAFHAALLYHRTMRYSSEVSSIDLEVWGQPVFVGEEEDANIVSARLKNDGVDNVIVYDPQGGYQIAQRFTIDVGKSPTEDDVASGYQWIEDQMDTWGSRINEEVNHYRISKKSAS